MNTEDLSDNESNFSDSDLQLGNQGESSSSISETIQNLLMQVRF